MNQELVYGALGVFAVMALIQTIRLGSRDQEPLSLRPGICECTHRRSSHKKGTGPCNVHVDNGQCACDVFIPKKDGGGFDFPTPTPEELERLLGK